MTGQMSWQGRHPPTNPLKSPGVGLCLGLSGLSPFLPWPLWSKEDLLMVSGVSPAAARGSQLREQPQVCSGGPPSL